MPIVHGPGVGRTLFMDGVNYSTTLANLVRWIRCQVPSNKEVVAVDAHLGDYGILFNLGDYEHKDSKVMDYLCYDQPIPVCIWEAEKDSFVIVRHLITGRSIHIPYVDTMFVERFKIELQRKEGIPVTEQRLNFGGRELVEGTLRDHDIKSGSTVYFCLKMRCGGGALPSHFVDVTKDKLRKISWNKDAPDWRVASHGLCLEGLCKNKACPAYNRMVVMNFDYDSVDLIGNPRILNRCKCPECWSKVIPLVPAFNNCFFRIVARKEGSTALFHKPWTRYDDVYNRYDIKECGEASFDRLQIFVRPLETDESKGDLPVPEKCAICFARLEEYYYPKSGKNICKLPNCNHYFHKSCVKDWAARGGNCPCCRAPMTN